MNKIKIYLMFNNKVITNYRVIIKNNSKIILNKFINNYYFEFDCEIDNYTIYFYFNNYVYKSSFIFSSKYINYIFSIDKLITIYLFDKNYTNLKITKGVVYLEE